MAELNIRRSDREGLVILQKMPEEVYESFLREIDRSAESVPSLAGLPPGDAERLLHTLQWASQIRAYADVEVEEFADDVCETLREHGDLKSEELTAFRQRLTRVFDLETLTIAAKAAALSGEHEHLFCSARVVTDARPVYGRAPSEPPVAMVITHILKIVYHGAGGQPNEIYLGLGTEDIKELRDVLDRADKKAKSLQSSFGSAKIKFIDPQQQ